MNRKIILMVILACLMGFITNYLMGGNILQQNVKSIKGKHITSDSILRFSHNNSTIREAVAAFKTESPDFNSPEAVAIYGPISKWDVSGVLSMSELFKDCTEFDIDISDWDVGNVTNMNKMFYNCAAFDQDIGSWDISGVTNMDEMFAWCRVFRGLGLDKWGKKLSGFKSMNFMFKGCKYIQVDLSSWNIRRCYWGERCKNMFKDTGYDRYDKALTPTDKAKLPNLLNF